MGGGLVEEHQRPVGEDDAGQGEPGPLAGRQRQPVLRDRRRQAAGGADPVLQRDGPQRLPQPLVVGGGRGQPEVVGDGAGEEAGPLRQPRHLLLPAPAADRDPSARDRPGGRLDQAGEHGEHGRLAAPGRPEERGDPALRDDEVEVLDGGDGPAVVGDGEAVRGERQVRHRTVVLILVLRQGGEPLEGRGALRGGVELRAHAAQRPVRLRGEEQHDQGGAQVEVALGQARADHDRDQRDRERGDQLEHRRGGEGQPERRQRGPAVAVGDRADHRRLRPGTAEGDQGGQPAHHVEEVARQRGHRAPLGLGTVAGRQAHQRPEDRQERQGGQHDHRGHQVLQGERDDGEQRQHGGQHQRRDVAREVGLGGRDPTGRQGRDLPRGRASGAARQQRPGQVASHRPADADRPPRRRPPRRPPPPGRARRPGPRGRRPPARARRR